jgi:hypothetical protein
MADNIMTLHRLAGDLSDADHFRRLTAYAIVKTLLEEVHDAAERLENGGRMRMILTEIKAQAGAMAGVSFCPQTKERHQDFYLSWVAKLSREAQPRG